MREQAGGFQVSEIDPAALSSSVERLPTNSATPLLSVELCV